MYQTAVLDAIGGGSAAIKATLDARMRDLNLDPATETEFLDGTQLDRLRVDAVRIGILFTYGWQGWAVVCAASPDPPGQPHGRNSSDAVA